MSWLSKGASKATGALFGGGSSNPNPFPPPNLDYLKDPSKLDFLKNNKTYNYLLDSKPYQSLLYNKPANPYEANLPGNAKTFSDTYTAPGYGKSDTLYQNLLDTTKGPSSVDAVREQLNNDQLQQLLSGIDTDTKNSIGSLKMDFADRGLSGPGMISDIEGNALAQAYGQGDKTKAAARTQLGQSSLDLLKNRENQNVGALTAAAGAGQAEDTQANQIAAGGAQTDVGTYSSLLGTQAGLSEQDLARQAQAQQLYYQLMSSNTQDYAGLGNTNLDLYANLLNNRDLAYATGQNAAYSNAAQLDATTRNKGIIPNILNNAQLNFGFGK